MPRQLCILCASDEGVFLDITVDNKQIFHEQFEICALVKVPIPDELSTKICHKCAYELNQCSSFVQKYKHAVKENADTYKQCCSICLEPAKNKFIFDIDKDKSLHLSLSQKLEKLFNFKLGRSDEDHKLICLSCRYTVDVLLDLKNVCTEISSKFNETFNGDIDYLTFPKINTTVVSRKTTITESARTNLIEELESRSNEMTRTRSQGNKLSNNTSNTETKLQVCSKCRNCLKAGDHMYKIHKTGDTVCKNCWKNTDVCTSENGSQVQQNVTETKLCTVFLTDVLKDTNTNEQGLYRIDEDDQGNKTYIVTDGNVANKNKHDKVIGNKGGNTGKQGQKRPIKSVEDQSNGTDNEDAPNKKHKSTVRDDIELKQSDIVVRTLKQLKQKRNTRNTSQSSDSDSSIKVSTKRNESTLTRHKRVTRSSLSDADVDSKRNHRKLKTILKGISALKSMDASDESLSNDDFGTKRKRLRFTSASPSREDLTTNNETHENLKENVLTRTIRRTRNQSKSISLSEVIFVTETYVCDECGASYENKLLGLTHKLTHYKQPKLILYKVSGEEVANKISPSCEAIDDQSDDPSEALAITVDDDEDESEEQLNNISTNVLKQTSSDADNTTHSSKKETVEDDVDVEFVLKESDDDHTDKPEKESEGNEGAKISVTNSLSQDEITVKEDQDEQRGSNNNYNDKTDENSHELPLNVEISHCNNENTVEKHEESKKEKDEGENNENELNNETEKNGDTMEKEKEEKNDITEKKEEEGDCVVEGEKEKHDVVEKREESDQGTSNSSTKESEVEEKTSTEREIVVTDKEVLNVSETVCEVHALDKSEVDSSDKVGCNESEKEETVNEIDSSKEIGLDDANNVKKIDEPMLPKSSQEIESSSESDVQTKTNTIDSEKPKIVEDIMLPEEGSIIVKNNVNVSDVEVLECETSKEVKSTSDSANAAAEVLQEVLDLANAEVLKRQEFVDKNADNETETLENISREIQNTVGMSPLKMDDAKSMIDPKEHPK